MRAQALFAVLALASLAASAEEKAPAQAILKEPLYFDDDNAGDAWGKSVGLQPHGLGLVFRIEEGKEVCHLLFFFEGDLGVANEKVLPVTRGKGTVTIGDVTCGWNEAARALTLPDGRPLKPDDGTVSTAIKKSEKFRHLLTPHLSAEALAAA